MLFRSLGPGGLRDIEFTVQLLQLVHGRTDNTVHQRDTIGAIHALSQGGYIGRSEANEFASHYRFLRLLEHRIQMSQMRRTHLMPTSENAQRALARAVNPKNTAEVLLARWEAVKLEVRGLHQRLFYRPLLSAVAKLEDSTLELSTAQAQDRLAAIGFSDPKGALTHIAALTSGLSRRAAIQKQLLPVLLQWFSAGTDPDSALLAFRRLSEDLGESHWYLRMLRDSSGAAERMTQVLGTSKLATALFERIPEAAAWFENPAELQPVSAEAIEEEISAIAQRHDDLETSANSIRQVRRRETLRLALGAVLGDLNINQVAKGLSDVTEVYLMAMLELVKDHLGCSLDFGIVGALSESDKNYLALNFLAFFNRDYRRVAELHIESGWVPANTRVEELEGAVRSVCEPYFDRPLKEISLGIVLMRLFQTSRRFKVEIQPQLTLLQKTLLNVEGLARQLDPDLDLWKTAKPILEKWVSKQLGWRGLLDGLKEEAPTWAKILPTLPRLIADSLAQGKHQIKDQTGELEVLKALLLQERRTHRLLAGALLFAGGFLAGILIISLGIY